MSPRGDAGPSGYTHSPDGRWWWDGQVWRPVQTAALQRPAASRASGGWTAWLIAVVVVVVVVASVPLALIASGFVSGTIGLATSHVRGISAPPYLPGATVSGIESVAVSRGLQCGRAQPTGFGGYAHVCQRVGSRGAIAVRLFGPDSGHLTYVNADVLDLQPADEPAVVELFGVVLSAAVARPDGAADATWLQAHFDHFGSSSTTVHGVTLDLMVSRSYRSLDIRPAGT